MGHLIKLPFPRVGHLIPEACRHGGGFECIQYKNYDKIDRYNVFDTFKYRLVLFFLQKYRLFYFHWKTSFEKDFILRWRVS